MDERHYNPAFFDARDIPHAMRIILTAENTSTEHRWKVETPYVAGLIGQSMRIGADTLLLDYGCGIGRIAKELIARHGCRVIGVDFRASMRALAVDYVGSDRFMACDLEMLDAFNERALRFDGAFSVWVLQHCLRPGDDIGRITKAVKPGGSIFVLNNVNRVMPSTVVAWEGDNIDIKAALASVTKLEREGCYR
jgi:2-polyprenyl-3-methyl-5-hydroxy-6-metoxy-1,4-benzoquinol methylase